MAFKFLENSPGGKLVRDKWEEIRGDLDIHNN